MSHREFLSRIIKDEVVARSQFARTNEVQTRRATDDVDDESAEVARWMIFQLASQIDSSYIPQSGPLRHGFLGMTLRAEIVLHEFERDQKEDVVFSLEGLRRDPIRLRGTVSRGLLNRPGIPSYSYEGYEESGRGWQVKWHAGGQRDAQLPDSFLIVRRGYCGPYPLRLTR
jgi:hypothetical protein